MLATQDVALSVTSLQELHRLTEGWPAAVYLAALYLKGRESPDDFVERLSGSNRYIADYLSEEVLNRQDPEVREFILSHVGLRPVRHRAGRLRHPDAILGAVAASPRTHEPAADPPARSRLVPLPSPLRGVRPERAGGRTPRARGRAAPAGGTVVRRPRRRGAGRAPPDRGRRPRGSRGAGPEELAEPLRRRPIEHHRQRGCGPSVAPRPTTARPPSSRQPGSPRSPAIDRSCGGARPRWSR